jgi:hypothetical protein
MPPDPPADRPRVLLCPHLQPGGKVGKLFAIHKRIADRDYRVEDLKHYGLYLFDTLIGQIAWDAMVGEAKSRQEPLIELALCWSARDDVLNRLNWEMMHGPDEGGFLASGGHPAVAITRLVAGTDERAWGVSSPYPPRIPYPPRVLFVLGSQGNEGGIQQIRPAAECLALLRQLRWNGHSIQSQILHRARPRRIKERIRTFRPHIVHFIGHGQPAAAGAPARLILEQEDQDEDGTEVAGYEPDQILKWLNVDGTVDLPPIVVLSACHTAGSATRMWGVSETAPLAARLVQGRVPMVVGMAGEVSDRGCRLFTRRFGQALLEGRSLVAAATQARWAALSETDQVYQSADWALPALFLAEAVAPGYVPVALPSPLQASAGSTGMDERMKVYDIEDRAPVFCGRDEFFDAYHELFHPDPVKGRQYSVVAAYSKTDGRGLGHSRLLLELTAQAIRDHHIPCLIGSDKEDWAPPTNREQLISAFHKAIYQARQAFGLSVAFKSQLDVLRRSDRKRLSTSRELDREVKASLGLPGDELSPEAVRMALKKDLDVLRDDVKRSCPDVHASGGHVLFVLHKIHQYAEALDDLLSDLLGPNGLTAVEPRVPVIMAFHQSGTESLQRFVESAGRIVESRGRTRPWLRPIELKPFASDGEDLLALERVLLHPFLDQPDDATKAWVIDWEANLADLKKDHKDFLAGIPRKYGSIILYACARLSIRAGTIRPADDAEILKGMPEL